MWLSNCIAVVAVGTCFICHDALAELEMLPISRNISGARQAAERIVNSL
ncbi:hypothetical protein [Peribacillus frigoritolerans]